MTTGSAAASVPVARAGARVAVIAAAALLFFVVVIVGGIASWHTSSATFSPSSVAVADIPADYLALYQQAAARFGVDWAVLAAIGKIECDHGRLEAAGCNPPGTVNGAGATGPMQFLGSTWRAGTPPMTVPAVGPPTSMSSAGYATDGDGDGLADVWNPADAIAGGSSAASRERSTGRLPPCGLRLQPRRLRTSMLCSRKAKEYRGAFAPGASGSAPVRARLGGRSRRPLHLQPRPANRPRRLGAGHAEPRAVGHDLRLLDVRPLGVRAGGDRHRPHDLDPVDGERTPPARATRRGDGRCCPRGVGADPPPGGYQPADLIFFGVEDGASGHVALWLGNGQIVQCSSSGDGSNIRPLAGYVAPTGWVRWRLRPVDETAKSVARLGRSA